MKTMPIAIQNLILSLLIFSLYPLSVTARSFFILSEDDFKDTTTSSSDDYSAKWDEFDPGSWRSIFEPDSMQLRQSCLCFGGRFAVHLWKLESPRWSLRRARATRRVMEEAVSEIDAAASEGHTHAIEVGERVSVRDGNDGREEQIQSFTVPSLRCQWL